jgi:hypothetical protein
MEMQMNSIIRYGLETLTLLMFVDNQAIVANAGGST